MNHDSFCQSRCFRPDFLARSPRIPRHDPPPQRRADLFSEQRTAQHVISVGRPPDFIQQPRRQLVTEEFPVGSLPARRIQTQRIINRMRLQHRIAFTLRLVPRRRHQQMHMIGHQDVSMDAATRLGRISRQPAEIETVILVSKKTRLPDISPLDQMQWNVRQDKAWTVGHGTIPGGFYPRQCNIKSWSAPCFPAIFPEDDVQIPLAQRRPKPLPLAEIAKRAPTEMPSSLQHTRQADILASKSQTISACISQLREELFGEAGDGCGRKNAVLIDLINI